MWLFITAVFLVVVFLLYKRPEQTQRGIAKTLLVVLGLFALFAVLFGLSSVQEEQRRKAERAEEANVVVTANYRVADCPAEKPLEVLIMNGSSKTVKAVSWDLEAFVPGHSTNLLDYATSYNSDAILKPNQFVAYCYPPPKLKYADVDAALLEFKIARPFIEFAEAQDN
jgi:hypothetical protein